MTELGTFSLLTALSGEPPLVEILDELAEKGA